MTIFPGRFGADFTVRVQETSGVATRVELRDPFPGNRGSERWAVLCSATEDPIRLLEFVADCRVSLDVRPFGVETVCFGPGVSPPAIYQMPRVNDKTTK